jgi:hypothetical protein
MNCKWLIFIILVSPLAGAQDSASPAEMLDAAREAVRSGSPELAIEHLDRLAGSGFTGVTLITGDETLATLAGRPAYDEVVEMMSRNAYPCEYDDAFAAFDFWLGEWEVHLADGRFAGMNTIAREEHGCLITEHWRGAGGTTGSSVNYVDKRSGEWVQVWNSAGGSQIDIRGGLTDEGMLLKGSLHDVSSGETYPFRGLWTPLPDGRVRQYFEQSNDGGDSWSTWFEGFYSRRDDAG